MARAVHAANAGRHISIVDAGNPQIKHANLGCRALIHTVDESRKYSKHAIKIVGEFRQGLYLRDVQFHVGSVSEWIDQQINARGKETFLSHAVLDLPSSHSHVEKATSALHVDGKLVLFNPSITQINQAMELVKTRRLPLQLERVVEVGPVSHLSICSALYGVGLEGLGYGTVAIVRLNKEILTWSRSGDDRRSHMGCPLC